MEITEVIGYLLAMVMGATIGVFGGGGSVLTVPILTYVVGISAEIATGYSLFVVGLTSLVGAVKKHREKLINYQVAIAFAVPSLIAVTVARYIVQITPTVLLKTSHFTLSKDMAIMLLFAVVMLFAAFSMLREGKTYDKKSRRINYFLIALEGLGVGFITGLVGAGGGFLIVPALVILVGLSIQKAIATSMVIIAVKSLSGFIFESTTGQTIDWHFLLGFTLASLIGLAIGLYLGTKIDSSKLKKSFGWFILIMAVGIIILEITL